MNVRNLFQPALVALAVLSLGIVGCNGEGGDGEANAPTYVMQEIMPGLSFVDSVVGKGAEVLADDFVIVHFTGYLYQNGVRSQPFDSSHNLGEPISFPLGRSIVITGWERGMPGMHVGGKRSLIVAPEFGLGSQGRPPTIPANSTLFFDIEVLDIGVIEIAPEVVGDGPVAEIGDQIAVQYTGWVWEDGKKGVQFDTSRDDGIPYRFTLGAGMVITGWDNGMEGMTVGTKARLIIPAVMGYGKRGNPPNIPADATLCFEVELVSIVGK